MTGRFDPFTQQELAMISMGIAAATVFVVGDTDDEHRKETAQVGLDMIGLMDEIMNAAAWKGDMPGMLDPELRQGLQDIVDGKRP